MEWLREIVLDDPTKLEKVRGLADVARDLNCTQAQLALAWAARHPHVSTVITGASRVAQVHENLKSLEVLDALTDEVLERIENILG